MGAANLLSVAAARRYRRVPVGYVDTKTLLVAIVDPANVLAIDDIHMITGLNCRIAVAAADDIEALIRRLNTLESAVTEASPTRTEEDLELGDVTELRESADDAPVIKLVYSILGQAATEGASDIHFEPGEDEMRVRFRVDGVLYEAARVPKRMISGVDLADQDHERARHRREAGAPGRPRRVNVEERKVDLRVTTLPTQRGEGATIRILDKEQALRTLDELGHGRRGPEPLRRRDRASRTARCSSPARPARASRPRLYAALSELNAVEKNIITIEDPVEYRIDGINQINVNPKAGLTFAAGLRSILRADPDIIMVGEIRDAETARIAIESALTGHMVLSTLHTNRRPGDDRPAGEDGDRELPHRLGGRLRRRPAAGAQALHALQAADDPAEDRARGGRLPRRADVEAYEPVGCARCNHTGYKGRIGIFSVMEMSERIKDLTVERCARGGDDPGRARGGDADPARGRAGQGPRRGHLDRRGRAGRLLARAQSRPLSVRRIASRCASPFSLSE